MFAVKISILETPSSSTTLELNTTYFPSGEGPGYPWYSCWVGIFCGIVILGFRWYISYILASRPLLDLNNNSPSKSNSG